MRSFKYAIVLAIGLTGCNSFNTYDPAHSAGEHQGIQQHQPKKDHGLLSFLFPDDSASNASEASVPSPTSDMDSTVNARDEQGRLLCPFQKLPVVPAPPPLPMEQLKQLAPKDKDATIQLLTDHIDALRLYATRVRDQQEKARRNYNFECKKWMQAHGE